MPGGVVYGLRQLRSKFVVFVPRLPRAREICSEQADHRGRAGRLRVIVRTSVQQATSNKQQGRGTNETTIQAGSDSGLRPQSACRSSPPPAAATTTRRRRHHCRADDARPTPPARATTEATTAPRTTAPTRRRPTSQHRRDRPTDDAPRRRSTTSAPTRPRGRRAAFHGPHRQLPGDTTEALADGAPVKIGFIGPQTGPLAAFGVIGQGMKVYFDKINRRGRRRRPPDRGHHQGRRLRSGQVGARRAGGHSRATRSSPRCSRSVRRTWPAPGSCTPTRACRKRSSAPASRLGRPDQLPVDDRRHPVVHRRGEGLGGVHQGEVPGRQEGRDPQLQQRLRQDLQDDARRGSSPRPGYEIVADVAHEADLGPVATRSPSCWRPDPT